MSRLLHSRLLLTAIIVCGVFTASNSAQAEVRSIEEFLKFKERWDAFVQSEYVWQLEGRYSGITDGTLTFINCPLPFKLPPEMGNSRDPSGVLEVTGSIVEDGKGHAFRVKKVTARPRDIDLLKTRRFGIDIQNPDEWYQLADWARGRGLFYNDKELGKAATELDRNGILAEHRRIKLDDEEGYAALLKKGIEKKLDQPLIQQLTHDELYTRYRNLRQREYSEEAWQRLQQKVAQALVKGNKPLVVFPGELNARYEADPRGVYAAASPAERQTLGRLLLIETILQRILHDARADGSNGFQISDRIQAEIPERVELQRKYFDLCVTWNMQRIATSTRAQLDELTSRLEKLGRRDEATSAREKWLTARESVFRQDGARGMADLAQLWLDLLKDQSKASRLMMDAWADNPQYTPAADWLAAHGYRLVDGKWLSEIEIAAMPEDPRKVAIREGRLEVGMTTEDVVAALGTTPTSTTRSVSRRQVTEWWTYQEAGIIVQFAKGGRERQSRVVSIEKINR